MASYGLSGVRSNHLSYRPQLPVRQEDSAPNPHSQTPAAARARANTCLWGLALFLFLDLEILFELFIEVFLLLAESLLVLELLAFAVLIVFVIERIAVLEFV